MRWTRVAPRRYFVALLFRKRNRRIQCFPGPKAPDAPIGLTGGKRRHLGDPGRLRAGRDEVNNPLYLRLTSTARELSGQRHKGLKEPIKGNLLTKN